MGCGAVPVRDESAGVECQSAELPREVLHTTDSRHRPGRTHSRQEVSMCRLVTARCYASAVLAVALGPSVSVRLSQVGVLSKRMNESSWFLACEIPYTRPTLR